MPTVPYLNQDQSNNSQTKGHGSIARTNYKGEGAQP